jgi:hypothetical protein
MTNECANCGKKHPQIVFHAGKWWCPGACDVIRGKKPSKKPKR